MCGDLCSRFEHEDASKVVECDRQEITLQRIERKVSYCTDDEVEDVGEQAGAKHEAPQEVSSG